MRSLKQTDILTGSIPKQLLLFFLPIWFGTLFQQLYNTADTLIVGNFVGTNALAAVGATGPFVNLLVGLFVGLCSGAGVVIAQSWGAHDPDAVDRQVHTALVLSVAVGALLTVLGLVTAAPMMRLLGTPDEILPDAALYLRIYFLGMIPQMLYNMGTNILRAIGDSKRPLYFLIAASLVNIVLDVVFIAVFGWGVAGAALATVLSQVASAVLTLRCIVGSQGMPWHIRAEKLRLHGDVFAAICTIGVPAAAQSAMYNISNMFIQSSMNSFGTSTIAAWGVYGKIDFLFWMTINSLGIAITTFAGQNFGARLYDRMKKSINVCLGISAAVTIALSAVLLAIAKPMLGLFSDDAQVIEIGLSIVYLIVPTYITYLFIEILSGAMRGAGDSLIPTIMTLTGVCLLRVFWVTVVVSAHHELKVLLMSYPITWIVTSAMFLVYYLRGKWLKRCIALQNAEN